MPSLAAAYWRLPTMGVALLPYLRLHWIMVGGLRTKVKVIFRSTICQPVSLGVKPRQGCGTRSLLLSDIWFCRSGAPSLTWVQLCHLSRSQSAVHNIFTCILTGNHFVSGVSMRFLWWPLSSPPTKHNWVLSSAEIPPRPLSICRPLRVKVTLQPKATLFLSDLIYCPHIRA